MAQINIQKKERSAMVWVIPLLLALLLLWWFFSTRPSGDITGGITDSTGAETTTVAARGAIADGNYERADEFMRFVANRDNARDSSEQHAYVAGGVRRLADAIENMNPGRGAVAKFETMRRQATALDSSPAESTRHSEMARDAFLAAADAFALLPGAEAASSEISQVQTTAEAVQRGPNLHDQGTQVDAFFDAASKALQAVRRPARLD